MPPLLCVSSFFGEIKILFEMIHCAKHDEWRSTKAAKSCASLRDNYINNTTLSWQGKE